MKSAHESNRADVLLCTLSWHGPNMAVDDVRFVASSRLPTRWGLFTAYGFVDSAGKPAVKYPGNPNGSPDGITGLTTADGRFTILMPHPERVFRSIQLSWALREWGEDSPWMRMFRNARVWVG